MALLNVSQYFKRRTTAPTAPAGQTALYAKTDGNLYTVSTQHGEAPLVPITTGPEPTSPRPGQAWLDPSTTYVPATNFAVADEDPGLTGPGLWVQTGLGSDGKGFTFWIEDGT